MKEKSKVDADSTSTLNKQDLVVKADLHSLEYEMKAYMKTYIDQKLKNLERLMNTRFTEVLNSLEQKNETVKQETIVKQSRQKCDPSDVIVDNAGPTSTDSVVKKLTNRLKWRMIKPTKQHHFSRGLKNMKRKDDDDHYKVNCSTLGFRQLDFVVAFPKSKNWFYLMYQQNKCWNDEDHATQDTCARTDEVADMEKSLINTIKGLSTCSGQPWHMVNEVPTDWTALKSYEGKFKRDPFQVEYVSEIAQQDSESLDCGVFVAVYTEYLSEGLGILCSGIDAQYHRLRYSSLLCKYGSEKAENG
ncbi:hypothetical protein BC332_01679 [Capsicum chinense]|nr:hypothetical protein BC332_01679 [Capsicum chinense]